MISANSLLGQNSPYEASIQQILQLDAIRKNQLQDEVKTMDAQKKALGDIGEAFSSLQSILNRFSDETASSFQPVMATASSDAIRVLSSENATETGSYKIEVEQLARRDTLHSSTFSADGTDLSAHGSGSFQISVGNEDPITISVDTEGLSNSEVMAAIRESVAEQAGDQFSLSVVQVTDSDSALSIKSRETGSVNAISISNIEGDFQTLSLEKQFAESELDAKFSVDGIEMSRSSNTIENAIEELSFELKEADATTGLTLVRDTEASLESIEEFINAFNELNSEIRNKTHLNAENDQRGVLQGQRAIRNLSLAMRQSMILPVSSMAESGIQTLSDVGLSIGKTGTLEISDSEKLESLLAQQPELVEEFFTAPDGIIQNLKQNVETSLSGNDNLLDTIEASVDNRIDRTNTRIEREERFLEKREAQLRDEFTRLNQIIEQGQSQFNAIMNFQSHFGF